MTTRHVEHVSGPSGFMDMLQSNSIRQFFAVVLVPTYNHANRLAGVLDGLRQLALPIILIDDGSSDQTPSLIAEWIAENPQVELVCKSHVSNRGKAAALQTGFDAARQLGATHVVTIDSDGQLEPSDVPAMLAASQQNPHAMIVGERPASMPLCPQRCSIGRRLANLAVRAECGLRISDSQCGLRIYPIELVNNVRCAGGRYSAEAEIITRATWVGYEVISIPVRCRYFAPHERVSHYRPWIDTVRQLGVHLRLLSRAVLPWPQRAIASSQRRHGGDQKSWWRRVGSWMNPLRCWREVRACDLGLLEFAAAIAIGVWIGTTPLFGLHAAICVYFAWRLHLHPAAMILGSQVSIPPLGIALAVASTYVGHCVLTGRIVPIHADGHWWGLPSLSSDLLPAWGLGSVVLGFLLGVCAFGLIVLAGWRLGSRAPERGVLAETGDQFIQPNQLKSPAL